VETFRAKAPPIDRIDGTASHADDPAGFDADVEAAAVSTEYARRLHPDLGLLRRALVNAFRPLLLPLVRRAGTPNIGNAVTAHNILVTSSTAFTAGDPVAGEKVFATHCAACHATSRPAVIEERFI
jgi:hypothetical protein